MNIPHTKRASLAKLVLVFLGLAFCVFNWGLQYKLSQYEPWQSRSHQIPEAKLLSRNERAAEPESPLTNSRNTTPKTALILLACVFLLSLFGATLRRIQTARVRLSEIRWSWQLRLSVSLSAFFFRPPPILA